MNEAPKKISIPREKQKRNIAIMLGLLAFVVIIYAVTILKIQVYGGAS